MIVHNLGPVQTERGGGEDQLVDQPLVPGQLGAAFLRGAGNGYLIHHLIAYPGDHPGAIAELGCLADTRCVPVEGVQVEYHIVVWECWRKRPAGP